MSYTTQYYLPSGKQRSRRWHSPTNYQLNCRQKNPAPPQLCFTLLLLQALQVRPTPKPSFLLLEVDSPTLPGCLAQMVETRGSRPSFDGTTELPLFSADDGDIGV